MILSGLTVSLALTFGYFRQETAVSVYGALFSFQLMLNDHFGPLGKRIIHLTTTLIFLVSSFYVGVLMQDSIVLVYVTLFALVFALGKSKGLGVELERLLLFTCLQFMTGAFSGNFRGNLSQPLVYVGFAFVNYVLCLCLVYFTLRHPPNFQNSKRSELRAALKRTETTRYAVTIGYMACLGLILAQYLNVERGYWVVGTVIIVMMPDRHASFHRSFQRLLGTVIGVLVASFIIRFRRDPFVLIGFSGLSAFLAPYGLIKNYWFGNVFVATLILFFLEISTVTVHGPFDLAFIRIVDIGLGCLLGAIGTLLAGPLKPRVI